MIGYGRIQNKIVTRLLIITHINIERIEYVRSKKTIAGRIISPQVFILSLCPPAFRTIEKWQTIRNCLLIISPVKFQFCLQCLHCRCRKVEDLLPVICNGSGFRQQGFDFLHTILNRRTRQEIEFQTVLQNDSLLVKILLRINGSIKTQKVEIAHGLQSLCLAAYPVFFKPVGIILRLDALHPRQKSVDDGNSHVILIPDDIGQVLDGLRLPVVKILDFRIFSGMYGRYEIICQDGELHLVTWQGIVCRRQKFTGGCSSCDGIRIGILILEFDVKTSAHQQKRQYVCYILLHA